MTARRPAPPLFIQRGIRHELELFSCGLVQRLPALGDLVDEAKDDVDAVGSQFLAGMSAANELHRQPLRHGFRQPEETNALAGLKPAFEGGAQEKPPLLRYAVREEIH